MTVVASIPNRASLWAALLLSGLCAGAGLFLALHYPLSAPAAVGVWLAVALAALRWWPRTPALLLGLLPIVGFAPWSGWISFEELDLLVLACAAGGYAGVALRLAPQQERAPAWRHMLVYSPLVLLLLTLFGASLLLALQRGIADAGGFVFGWYQGYHEPMNSLRLSKSFFLVALLLPLWKQAGASRPGELSRALLWGMVLALAGCCLAAIWERHAFTGLLDFSTDYRSTALFWEMHVGGAALDGCLALTAPFAVLALLRARTPAQFMAMMLLAMLTAYVCLTTFSRGVYLAVPLGLATLVLLRGGQRRRAIRVAGANTAPLMSVPPAAKLGGLLLAAAFVGAAALMFGSSGYRGLLALLGAMLVLLIMPASLWLPSTGQRVTAVLAGGALAALLSGACLALSMAVPKAAYATYLLALACALFLRWRDKPGQAQPIHACLLTASWFWLLAGVVTVADYWGGPIARWDAFRPLLLLTLLWPLMLMRPALWPFKAQGIPGWRDRGLLFGGLLLAASVISALAGGAYLRDRVSNWRQDLQVRFDHWNEGLAMLQTPQDWLLGKGAGRFVANHFFTGPAAQHTGDYRLKSGTDGRFYLVLSGGKHVLGYGELFRVSQRIAPPQGEVLLRARVRATQDVSLQAEICERHLLYIQNCLGGVLGAKAKPGEWQELSLPLGRAPAMGGAWYAPRLISFAIAMNQPGSVAEIAALRLSDVSGRELLANADFSDGMAHWFFSSDRHHLPWHAKSLGLHVLLEQGLIGVALLTLLVLLALWRLSFGRGREHVLAPALVASLLGFLAVGLFDSLIDAPRIGFMFYALLGVGLGLRALPGAVVEKAG
ncbi:hypothetical protein [Roseateles violae]|uniref:O-antigen ligase-like membrane protein n=1 Tax=Roseateles violae TaxID=3058042 RepID=A0ABT8DNC6_9BURK|nr:hypothetical protein [Pelomonas sp. PFR6]MDN3919642.1 hypothetical protein [Pelomonas sp. PFR6]